MDDNRAAGLDCEGSDRPLCEGSEVDTWKLGFPTNAVELDGSVGFSRFRQNRGMRDRSRWRVFRLYLVSSLGKRMRAAVTTCYVSTTDYVIQAHAYNIQQGQHQMSK